MIKNLVTANNLKMIQNLEKMVKLEKIQNQKILNQLMLRNLINHLLIHRLKNLVNPVMEVQRKRRMMTINLTKNLTKKMMKIQKMKKKMTLRKIIKQKDLIQPVLQKKLMSKDQLKPWLVFQLFNLPLKIRATPKNFFIKFLKNI